MCVRLDRRAVYLGTPGGEPALPGRGAIGRRRAILVEPRDAARAGASALPTRAAPVATASAGGSVFTGLGFDACTAPSSRSMAAWGDSPYRGDRRLHRRPQPRLLAAEPDRELGQRPDRSRLAPDPDLRRPAGADQRLQQLRQAQPQPGDRAGRGGGESTRSPRPAALGDGPRQPDLLRHGVLHARPPAPPPPRSPSSRPGPKSCTRSATSPASTAAAPPGSRTSPARSAPATTCPTTSGSPTGTARRTPPTPTSPPAPGPSTSASTSTAAATTRRYGGVTINIDNNYVDGGDGRQRGAAGGERRPGRLPRPDRLARAGAAAGQGLGLRPQRADRTAGDPRSTSAAGPAPPARSPTSSARSPTRSRLDVGAKYPAGRARRTASTSAFPTVKSGPQPVCVYALNVGPGADRLLGCKDDRRSRSRSRSPTCGRPQRGVRVRVACDWPAGHRVPRPARAAHPLQGRRSRAHAAARPRIRDRHALARPPRLPAHRRALARLHDPAQRRRPGAAAAARRAEDAS